MNLAAAIQLLEIEIEQLGTPKVETAGWWVLRAKSTGLSLLRTMRDRGISDPEVAEAFRKGLRKELVGDAG